MVDKAECAQCDAVFHPSCLSRHSKRCNQRGSELSESEVGNGTITEEVQFLKMEITFLRRLLLEQEEKNKILIENNQLLREKIEFENPVVGKEPKKNNKRFNGDQQNPPKQYKEAIITEPLNSSISATKPLVLLDHASGAGHVDGTRLSYADTLAQKQMHKMQEIVNLNVDTNHGITIPIKTTSQTSNGITSSANKDNVWSIQRRRQVRKKEQIIIGNKDVINNEVGLKVAPKKAFLYVSRLQPGTAEQDVTNFLKPKFPEAECKALESKFPQHYTSFKVTIDLMNLERAMCSAIWPCGTYVTRFFHRPAKKTTPT